MLQPRVTALFYLENSRRIHPLGIRACQPKDVKKREWGSAPAHRRERGRERERARFGSSFYLSFPTPLGLLYVNWASWECCFFYLSSSLWSSDLPLFYILGLFPSLSLKSDRHFGLLFPILTTQQYDKVVFLLLLYWFGIFS